MKTIRKATSALALAAAGFAAVAGSPMTAQANSPEPGVWSARTIGALSSRVFTEVFYAGVPAQVWLRGDGDTNLDLYVWDENNRLVCASETYGDREICRWHPRWTGQFYIEIVNFGSVYNVADIGTN